MERRIFHKKSFLGLSTAFLSFLGFSNSPKSRPAAAMKIHKPKRLLPGDNIGLIAPGSSFFNDQFQKAVNNLEGLGFKLKFGKYLHAQRGYLAGTDEQRLHDLHQMFADDTVKGIWCIRGGYGCSRLLPYIDYQLIKRNPKVFIGYSDITALLQAIHQQTGLVCFHGPVGTTDFTEYTVKHLRAALMETKEKHIIEHFDNPEEAENEAYQIEVIRSGEARGTLIGGNLSLLSALTGTPYEWKVKNKLLFIEDVGERPYRIDRMLTQILQSVDLAKAAGIILGVFIDCKPKYADRSLSLSEALKDRLYDLGIPVIYGLSFGHIPNQFTLPLGINAAMDTQARTVTLLENAVKF